MARHNSSPPSHPATLLYKAMWRITKGKRLETGIKLLKEDSNQLTNEFLNLAQRWGQLRSNALVRSEKEINKLIFSTAN